MFQIAAPGVPVYFFFFFCFFCIQYNLVTLMPVTWRTKSRSGAGFLLTHLKCSFFLPHRRLDPNEPLHLILLASEIFLSFSLRIGLLPHDRPDKITLFALPPLPFFSPPPPPPPPPTRFQLSLDFHAVPEAGTRPLPFTPPHVGESLPIFLSTHRNFLLRFFFSPLRVSRR